MAGVRISEPRGSGPARGRRGGISLTAAALPSSPGRQRRAGSQVLGRTIRHLIHMEVDPGFDARKLTPGDAGPSSPT